MSLKSNEKIKWYARGIDQYYLFCEVQKCFLKIIVSALKYSRENPVFGYFYLVYLNKTLILRALKNVCKSL